MRNAPKHLLVVAVAVSSTAWSIGCAGDAGPAEQRHADRTAPTLQIYFPKMYSAFIPDSEQTFEIPAVVVGKKADSWECSDPDAISVRDDESAEGAMFTMQKAGTFSITARSGREYGEAELVVTEATEEQLSTGFYLYNRVRTLGPMEGRPAGTAPLVMDISCSTCHGSNAQAISPEQTPQQAGGYSDDEIKAIVSLGQKPEGAQWGTFPGIRDFYSMFHRWPASDEEYQAIVIYLRSFEPKPQDELD